MWRLGERHKTIHAYTEIIRRGGKEYVVKKPSE
jgi:hypothetical protein